MQPAKTYPRPPSPEEEDFLTALKALPSLDAEEAFFSIEDDSLVQRNVLNKTVEVERRATLSGEVAVKVRLENPNKIEVRKEGRGYQIDFLDDNANHAQVTLTFSALKRLRQGVDVTYDAVTGNRETLT